jgi:hypothetical protein
MGVAVESRIKAPLMSVTLSTSDLITIGGVAASVICTAASIGWAVHERKQAKSAQEETARFRRLLLKQQISQQFSDVPPRALALFRHVRATEWEKGAEVALLLSADLASLNGIDASLVGAINKDQVGTTLNIMSEINQRIPRNNTAIPDDVEDRLLDGCNVILIAVNAIERSLRVEAALGGGEDGE